MLRPGSGEKTKSSQVGLKKPSDGQRGAAQFALVPLPSC